MANPINILNSNTSFDNYFSTNSISKEAQNKLATTNFVVVPTEYTNNEFYFAQESISFIKFCRQNYPEHTFDILADGDVQIRSLHSFDIWLPVIYIAEMFLFPLAVNFVYDYIKDKMKGREKEEAKVDVTFIVRRDNEEKTIHYSGDAKTFKESFEKIDINKM